MIEMVFRVTCPECGLTYTAESFEQLEAIPSHPKKFWNYSRCICGYIFETKQWWFRPLEEVEQAAKEQFRIMFKEWIEAVGIRRILLTRANCSHCQEFPELALMGDGAYADQERERVNSIKNTCGFSLTLSSSLEHFIDLVQDGFGGFGGEGVSDLFPELLTILENFKAKLIEFRQSRHQDEGENDPIP